MHKLAWGFLCALGLTTWLPSPVQAQPPYFFSVGVSSTHQDGNLSLRFKFDGSTERATVVWNVTPNGLDLYRRTAGIECGEFERLNPEPFAWTWESNSSNPMNIDYVDTTTLSGNAYEYTFRAVDAARNPIPTNPDVFAGYVTNGEALIGHGKIGTLNLCGYPIDDYAHLGCPLACLPFFTSLSAILEPYANTEQTLNLYGQLSTAYNCEGSFATFGVVTRVVSSVCFVGVESTTWWEVKRLYR